MTNQMTRKVTIGILCVVFAVVFAFAMALAVSANDMSTAYAYNYDTLTSNDITATSGSKGNFSWEKIQSVDTSKHSFKVGSDDKVLIKYTVSNKSDVKLASISFSSETHTTQGTEHDSFRAKITGTNLQLEGIIPNQGWTYSAQRVQYDGSSNQIVVELSNTWQYHYSIISGFNFTIARGEPQENQIRITAGVGIAEVNSAESGKKDEVGRDQNAYWDKDYASTTTSIRTITPHPQGWYYTQYGLVRIKDGYAPQDDWIYRWNNEYSVGCVVNPTNGYYDFGVVNAKIVEYTITYNLDGGIVDGANVTKYNVSGDSFTLINPTKENYTFAGWTGSNGNTPQTSVTVAQGSFGDKTYTANWIPDPYSIEYNGMAGAEFGESHPTEARYGDVIQISNPTKIGYTFTGWTATGLNTEEAKHGTTETPETAWDGSSTKDTYFLNLNLFDPVTMTANWKIANYDIEYIMDGGEVESLNRTTYTMFDVSFTLNNPTKDGYTFTGWTGSNGDIPETEVVIENGSYGDKTYTANWTANSYNVKVAGENVEVVFDEMLPNVAVPTKDGYTFFGYYDAENEDGTPTPTGTRYIDENGQGVVAWDKAENDVALYAYFTINMTASVEGYEGEYDGNEYGITITVTVPEDGYTVEYKENEIRGTENPKKTEVGVYNIEYYVNKDGYTEFKGFATIRIKEANKTALTNIINSSTTYYNSIKDDYETIAADLLTGITDATNVKNNANVTAQQVATAVSDLQTVFSAIKIAVTEVKIDEIGEVEFTDEIKNDINAARKAYNGLTDAEKAFVSNYDVLTAAESQYEELKNVFDKEKAGEVEELIDALKEVEPTAEFKQKIVTAKSEYNKLSGDQKKLVSNYDDIAKAEDEYRAALTPTDLSTLTEESYQVKDDETLTGSINGNIRITVAANATIVLDNANINGEYFNGEWSGISCEGNATIILKNSNFVKSFGNNQSGIYVPDGATLTIKGNGSIRVEAKDSGAGIGSSKEGGAGRIVIESGNIEAIGGGYYSGAGIGSGYCGSYQEIVIKGGTVYAEGGFCAAGIGAGEGGDGGNINISGGTVTARGGRMAAAIGGGYGYQFSGSITITAGVEKVDAHTDNEYVIGRGTPEYEEYYFEGNVNIGGKNGQIEGDSFIYEPFNDVINLIEAIGTVEYTNECKNKITAARNAYDALSESRRESVTNYEKLTAAEEVYEAMKVVDTAKTLIDAIGEPEYTDTCKQKIDAAREAYDAVPESERSKVDNYALLTAAESFYISADAEAKINALPAAEAVTLQDKADIMAARAAYDDLTNEQKELVEDSVVAKLESAEKKIETLDVIEMINALPLASAVTLEDGEEINAVRNAYDELDDEDQKPLINAETLAKLTDAEAAYKVLNDEAKSEEAKALINAIGMVEYTEESKDKIEAARNVYDSLTEDQKALVGNVNALVTAEGTYTALRAFNNAAYEVKELIANIGAVEYTPENKEKIEAARNAYNALTDEQKALVTNISLLTDAEETFAVKQAEADKRLSGGAIAGIVVGVVFGVIILACVGLFLLNKFGIVKLAFVDKVGKVVATSCTKVFNKVKKLFKKKEQLSESKPEETEDAEEEINDETDEKNDENDEKNDETDEKNDEKDGE